MKKKLILRGNPMKLHKKKKIEITSEIYGYPSFKGSYYQTLSDKEIQKLDEYSKNPNPSFRARLVYKLHRFRTRLSR